MEVLKKENYFEFSFQELRWLSVGKQKTLVADKSDKTFQDFSPDSRNAIKDKKGR